MSSNKSDEDALAAVMNRDDEPIFVSADIEHDSIIC